MLENESPSNWEFWLWFGSQHSLRTCTVWWPVSLLSAVDGVSGRVCPTGLCVCCQPRRVGARVAPGGRRQAHVRWCLVLAP